MTGCDEDSDSHKRSGGYYDPDSGTDTETDTNVPSSLEITLEDPSDAGPDGGGFINTCENSLGYDGGLTSFGFAEAWGGITWFAQAQDAAFVGRLRGESSVFSKQPGTYLIGDLEESLNTCSICLYVVDPVLRDSGDYKAYMPVAGSGNITLDHYDSHSPVGSEFSGEFNVVLREVVIDQTNWGETTTVPGGCSGRLTGSWSGTLGSADRCF